MQLRIFFVYLYIEGVLLIRNLRHIQSQGDYQGFTLIELMVVLAISAILLAVAAPSFSVMIKKSRSEALIRELGSALSLARTEAVSRGVTVSFCRTANGGAASPSCVASGVTVSATDGWLIFQDTNGDGNFDSGETLLRAHDTLTTTRLSVADTSSTEQRFARFNRHGASNQRIIFTVCESSQEVIYARALLMENTGRITGASKDSSTGIYLNFSGANLTCP